MELKTTCLKSDNIIPELLSGKVVLPNTIDNRDLMLKTENQGSTSTCAAQTCTSWLESVMWRKTLNPMNYDAYKLYDYAKTIDGYPGVDGTTLDAVLKGCIHFGWINGRMSDIVCTSSLDDVKKYVFKYGCVLTAFNVSDGWMRHYGKLTLDGNNLGSGSYGHAMICCGCLPSGLLLQNSWGVTWGKDGFVLVPWDVCYKQFSYCGIMRNCLDGLN